MPDRKLIYVADPMCSWCWGFAPVIREMVEDLENNILAGLILVVVVLVLFMGMRTSLIVAMAIPFSMLMSFALIQVLGYTLNMVVLFSLVLALGMLVDNAVQICDQTRRLQTEGMSPFDAALSGANQLAFPILIATGTTIAAFYPMPIGLQVSTYEYIFSLPVPLTVTLAFIYILAIRKYVFIFQPYQNFYFCFRKSFSYCPDRGRHEYSIP